MKKILLVDDEFDLTSTLKAVLEDRGYQVETCATGREALECVRSARPDLVLLDVMIPLGSGYEVLDRMHGSAGLADTPVVLMNHVPPPADRAVRWQGFIKKPLSLAAVIEVVEQLVGAGSPPEGVS